MANTARLVIDPIARKISTKYEKIRLVQYDNNSEEITFEMPRYVRGNDMLTCSPVEVHYDNISINRKQKNSDVYVVTDIVVAPEDENTINFSWLVSRAATKLVGSIEFSLHFGRTEDEYAWHTTTYSGINVLAGKHNTQSVVEKYPDLVASILEQVEKMLTEVDVVDIAQTTGDSTEAVMSQKATTDALGGKVDKITKAGNNAYVSNGNGYLPVSASNNAGSIVTYGSASGGTEDKGGHVTTSMPKNPYHATPQKYVDEAVERRVPTTEYQYKLYGTRGMNEVTGKVNQSYHSMSATGMTTGDVVQFHTVTGTTFDNKEPTCTIGVCDPIKPIQATNMRYVDAADNLIREDVDLLKRIAFGALFDVETVSSTDNPLTVPNDALPEATIDKIGTGIAHDVQNDVVPNSVGSVSTDEGVTGSALYNNGLYTIASNGMYMREASFTIDAEHTVSGTDIYVCIENVGGSYMLDTNSGIPNDYTPTVSVSMVSGDTLDFALPKEGEKAFLSFTVATGDKFSDVCINSGYAPMMYNDLQLRITIGTQVDTYGVPVTAVQKNGETIYTVPEAIRNLTGGLLGMEVYGLALSDAVYNYLDLENKVYVVNCAHGTDEHNGLAIVPHTDEIDVSEYLTDEDGEITVAEGDKILFVGENGNPASDTVPSTITYAVVKGG